MKSFTVTCDTSLGVFTDNVFPQGSFYLRYLLRDGAVRVNGVRTRKNIPLHAGDRVTYYTTAAQEGRPSHTTVYEDGLVIIADKFQGVSSEGLESELSGDGEIYLGHRLDRNTAGLIALGRNIVARDALFAAFRDPGTVKEYMCLCLNAFASPHGRLTAYLSKDAASSSVTVRDTHVPGSRRIETEYEVIGEMGDIALVRVTLHSGKTHQIRAHMAHIGCPVLGDEKYGNTSLNAKYSLRRQQLVAKRLTLRAGGVLSYLDGRTFESQQTLRGVRNKT